MEKRRFFGFGRPVIDQALEEEMDQHLELLTTELVEAGWEPAAARAEAARRFGDPTRHAAACRRQSRVTQRRRALGRWCEELLADARLAVRRILSRPAFSAAVVATFALALAAVTTMVAVMDGVLWKELPYPDADRLVTLWQVDRATGQKGAVSPPNFFDWRDQLSAVESLAAWGAFNADLAGDGPPEVVRMAVVSADFFRVLRAEASHGQTLSEDDFKAGGAAMLSHGLWQRRYGGDPRIVGQRIRVSGEPVTVSGILPPAFAFPDAETDLWLPNRLPRERGETAGAPYRAYRVMWVLGRLHADASVAAAGEQLSALAHTLEEQYPKANTGQGAALVPLREHLVGASRPALLALGGAVIVVLLLACANVANLLLVQVVGRRGELALRTALGGSSRRLGRQLLTEYLLLAALGGLLGLLLGRQLLHLMLVAAGDALPRAATVALDGRVLWTVLGLTLGCGLLAGLLPVWRSGRLGPASALAAAGRQPSDPQGRRIQGWLVTAEIAIALPLLVAGGLLTRSYLQLSAVDPGFRPAGVTAVAIALPRTYEPQRWRPFFNELLTSTRDLPGVESAALALQAPMLGMDVDRTPIAPDDRPLVPGESPSARHHLVSEGYFETLGVPLVAGRTFDDFDRHGRPGVAIINETLAATLWPGEDPIGRRLRHEMQLQDDEPTEREVVGVVADMRHFGLDAEPEPQLYLPAAQTAWFSMTLLVRSDLERDALAQELRRTLAGLDADLPLGTLHAMPEAVAATIRGARLERLLILVFAASALLLAGVGLHGVLAYLYAQRQRELGVRVAMGACPEDLLRLMAGDGFRLVGRGLLLGIPLALVAGHLLEKRLFNIGSLDPWAYGTAALLLVILALLAAAGPARRALGVEPAQALRAE